MMSSIASLKLQFTAGLCAILLVPAALAAADTAGTQPKLSLPETQKDAGTFDEGTVVPFRFVVANSGQADLEILQVKPSCGCTVAKWDHVIKPGAQGTIQAEMNTLYFRGAVTKHLTVVSNDPDQPEVDLSITAHLRPLVKVSPDTDALLTVKDQPVSQEFTLERSGDHPMKVLQVISYAPYLKAATTPLPGVGRYKLTVTAAPDAPLGRSKAAVVVWTDIQEGGALTFFLTVDRGIVPIPPSVFYGIIPRELKSPLQATVTILRNSAPFHVKSATVSDPRLSSRLETVRDGAEYRVTVKYAGGWDPGRRQQMLTVTTDDPKQPVIQVPIQAIVQAKIASTRPLPSH